MRHRGGEAGAELLVGGQLGQGCQIEDERGRVDEERLLRHPAPRRPVTEGVDSGRAGGDEPSLAVEHDDALVQRLDERPHPFEISVHHPFTSPSPFGDP